MRWYEKLFGWAENSTDKTSQSKSQLPIELEKALVRQKDALRIEVLQEVRGQMTKVFGVVESLKKQVNTLSTANNALSQAMDRMHLALASTNQRFEKLVNTVQDNASKSAKGFSDVNHRLNAIGQDAIAAVHPFIVSDDPSAPKP